MFGRASVKLAAAAVAGVAVASMAPAPASAHPHVWVTSQSRVVFEKNAINAIEQSWTFDEFYSAMAVQGLDTNNDGVYSDTELAELTKVNMEGLKEFGYFTTAKIAGAPLQFDTPTKARLEFTGGILSLHFTLPLKTPAPIADFAFATYDNTNFVAFELAKDDAVTLFGAPQSCGIELRSEEPAAAGQGQNQTLAGAFAEQFGSASIVVTKWAMVDCKKA